MESTKAIGTLPKSVKNHAYQIRVSALNKYGPEGRRCQQILLKRGFGDYKTIAISPEKALSNIAYNAEDPGFMGELLEIANMFPGFLERGKAFYPSNKRMAGWLAVYYANKSLGNYRGTNTERAKLAREFADEYKIPINIDEKNPPSKGKLIREARRKLRYLKRLSLILNLEEAEGGIERKKEAETEEEKEPESVQLDLFTEV